MRKRWMMLAMILSIVIASAWDKYPIIKNSANAVLNPTFGALLNFNLVIGMLIIVFILALIISLIQKYTTNQKELKEIREEQRKMQEEMKKFRDNPAKMMEMNKRQMEIMGRSFRLSMGSIVYTAVPFVLFFRWFGDYFSQPLLTGFKFFGIFSWFWFYLIFSIIFSSIIRKVLKIA